MGPRHRYKNPPIEEAICEFRFEPSQEWDLTIPGKLHLELREQYPGKPEQRQLVKVNLDTREGDAHLQYGEGPIRVQLVSEQPRRVVSVGPDVLSVHMLSPYQDPDHPDKSGWDEFKPRLKEALNAYWGVANPKGVRRVGLRYINKILIPRGDGIEKYLICALPQKGKLPKQQKRSMSRAEYSAPNDMHLTVIQSLPGGTPENNEFFLDIDVTWKSSEPISRSDALSEASSLRDYEREIFESVITDKAKELFDER